VFRHVTIAVSDRDASERFYDLVLATLGVHKDRGAEAAHHGSMPGGRPIDHLWIRVADVQARAASTRRSPGTRDSR
jgi:catechol 2,3-dioxygenase-like lactoylglutathione lyase family enzyme